jgi:hypothetical protein
MKVGFSDKRTISIHKEAFLPALSHSKLRIPHYELYSRDKGEAVFTVY